MGSTSSSVDASLSTILFRLREDYYILVMTSSSVSSTFDVWCCFLFCSHTIGVRCCFGTIASDSSLVADAFRLTDGVTSALQSESLSIIFRTFLLLKEWDNLLGWVMMLSRCFWFWNSKIFNVTRFGRVFFRATDHEFRLMCTNFDNLVRFVSISNMWLLEYFSPDPKHFPLTYGMTYLYQIHHLSLILNLQ